MHGSFIWKIEKKGWKGCSQNELDWQSCEFVRENLNIFLFFKLWVKCILVVYTRSRVGWECASLNWFVTSLLCWESFPPTRWREIQMNILQDSFSPLCDLIGSILTLSNTKRFDAFSFVFINCSSFEIFCSVRRKLSNNPQNVITKSITVPFCL